MKKLILRLLSLEAVFMAIGILVKGLKYTLFGIINGFTTTGLFNIIIECIIRIAISFGIGIFVLVLIGLAILFYASSVRVK